MSKVVACFFCYSLKIIVVMHILFYLYFNCCRTYSFSSKKEEKRYIQQQLKRGEKIYVTTNIYKNIYIIYNK